MDLWIRSQDRKRLIPKPNLYVVYSEKSKCAYIGDTMVGHIAKYDTEERAIEVLDEIQSAIEHNGTSYYSKEDDALYNLYEVYEMSKE